MAKRVAIALEVDRRQAPQLDDPAERDAFLASLIDRVRAAVVDHHGIVLSAVSVLSHGAMPKTSSGKLRRRACRDAFGDGSLDEIARWVADPELASPLMAGRSARTLEALRAKRRRVGNRHVTSEALRREATFTIASQRRLARRCG